MIPDVMVLRWKQEPVVYLEIPELVEETVMVEAMEEREGW